MNIYPPYGAWMIMKKYGLLLIIVLLLSLAVVASLRTRWANSLIKPKAPFPLELIWQVDLGYSSHDRSVYQEETIFLPSTGLLMTSWYGIDAVKGEVKWSHLVGIEQSHFVNCLTSDYLVLSGIWLIQVLSTRTGWVVWEGDQHEAGSATCSKTAVFSSGVPRDSIAAYDITTGQELWSWTQPINHLMV